MNDINLFKIFKQDIVSDFFLFIWRISQRLEAERKDAEKRKAIEARRAARGKSPKISNKDTFNISMITFFH